MASPIGPDGFEAKFRLDPDPWNYASSRFEAFKRAHLLHHCGGGCCGRTLELGCANGFTTVPLADRSLRTVAIDASEAALVAARLFAGVRRDIRLVHGILPKAMPRGPFDLIVVSELVYYLGARDRERLRKTLPRALAPGGRIVVLNHSIPFADASVPPAIAHRSFVRALAAELERGRSARTGRFQIDVLHRALR